MMKDIPKSQRCGRMRGDLRRGNIARHRRRRPEPERLFAIRRDGPHWTVTNGTGAIVATGFLTDVSAAAWVAGDREHRG